MTIPHRRLKWWDVLPRAAALDVTIGDRSVLHLEGQEGDADNETEGLEILKV